MKDRERLLDLLAARATEGLSREESAELAAALRGQTDIGADDLDLAAAAVDLALTDPAAAGEALPAHLGRRILELATLAEQRTSFLEGAADAIRVAWAPPEIAHYARVRGDVVWSTGRQAGFLRLRGLPANRSSEKQYQLWIVDPSRDRNPIDGGVFDVPAGVDEVVVPIDAKLRVDDPQAFAITLEQAGGVVVSDGPLLVVAPVGT